MSPKVIAKYSSQVWSPSSRLTKTLHTKAYLVFLDQPWRRFVLALSIAGEQLRVHFYDRSGCSISPAFNIYHNPTAVVAILAIVMFGPRLCIGFDPTVIVRPTYPLRVSTRKVIYESTCADIPDSISKELKDGHDLVTHLEPSLLTPQFRPVTPPDHVKVMRADDVPPFDLPARENTNSPLIDPVLEKASVPDDQLSSIGEIQVRDVIYEILEVLFSSGGFLGRGTVIYLARRDGKLYIIKDHWVENPSQEAEMMKLVQGTPGVPTLIDSWEVEIEPNIVDTTSRYRTESCQGSMKGKRTHVRAVTSPRGRPLTKFRSKRELVACIKDVLLGNPGFVHEISKANVQFSPKGDCTETQGSSPRCQSLQHFNI